MTPERNHEIDAFLESAGWGGAVRVAIQGDASTRSYERVSLNGRKGLVMNQPQKAEAAACPPDATPAARAALGYNAQARLAGANVRAFSALASYLGALGLSAPRVFAEDAAKGLLLIEDFGEGVFAQLTSEGADPEPLYRTAIDALVRLHRVQAPKVLPHVKGDIPLLSYDSVALAVETELLPEWHGKLVFGEAMSGAALEDWRAAWAGLIPLVVPAKPVLVLRDYHAENLLWLPERAGTAKAGLIDFQDGLAGHPAYDVVSLLEDARRDVEPELRAKMLQHYCAARLADDAAFDLAEFEAAAAILSAQRNAKIAGIFARLHLRDGKPRYLNFLPRVWGYLENDLRHPALAPVAAWFETHMPQDKRAGAAMTAGGIS
jgi:aminoglycoside/choline kinase family phosphotransferase